MEQFLEQTLQNPIPLLLIIVWSLFWKGLALWRAAQNKQKYWFIAILPLNTAGILEIVYLVGFAKKGKLSLKKFLPISLVKEKKRDQDATK